MRFLDTVGLALCLIMIITTVLLSVIKSPYLMLGLFLLLVLWAFVSLCRQLLQSAEQRLDSRNPPHRSMKR